MEGAPGLCLPLLETRHHRCTSLALWPVPAHSEKNVCSALPVTSPPDRPHQEEAKARANARLGCGVYTQTQALCAKDGRSPPCLNPWRLSLAEHKVGGPLRGSRELGALATTFSPQISETQHQTPFASSRSSGGTPCASSVLTCVSPSFPHRVPLMAHGDRWVSYLYVINI